MSDTWAGRIGCEEVKHWMAPGSGGAVWEVGGEKRCQSGKGKINAHESRGRTGDEIV